MTDEQRTLQRIGEAWIEILSRPMVKQTIGRLEDTELRRRVFSGSSDLRSWNQARRIIKQTYGRELGPWPAA